MIVTNDDLQGDDERKIAQKIQRKKLKFLF